ncbi:MAG: ethanolamine permease [Gammaproteobacteria bacterium]|nr:ethanolamine permease [Gammaproteobacteria bacterium]
MSDDKRVVGSVEYHVAEEAYFEKRGLKRYAGAWSLWALGVGAVISGDFFGWNFGLGVAGFGGLLIATIIIAIMYIGMCYSIAEMSPALPHTGGAYSFGRSAMGPWGGFITGLAENMEYVLTPAVIVVGIGGYMGAIFNDLLGIEIAAPLWWALSYIIFVGLNIIGAELTFKFSVFITFLALIILATFWIGAIPLFSWEHALNIQPTEGNSIWLPMGWAGVAAALPFAIWFYLAIEQLPLAAEESHDPKRDMPKGLLYGILTLIIASILTLFLNSGIAPGSAVVGQSDEPLFLAFQTIFGEGIGASLLALIAVAGLIASFHTIIYAYGRNIYSLSRAGYFPHWLSVTHDERKTPHVALITGAIIGYIVALIIEFGEGIFGGLPVGAVLLNMAVFGAVIAYIMQMIAFILLRKNMPHIHRPYVSPLGNFGAIVAGVIAFVTLIFLFLNPDYVVGVYGCAIWFAAGLIYFALVGRKNLVYSPEEAFAVDNTRQA